jgi:hypothetical protein
MWALRLKIKKKRFLILLEHIQIVSNKPTFNLNILKTCNEFNLSFPKVYYKQHLLVEMFYKCVNPA